MQYGFNYMQSYENCVSVSNKWTEKTNYSQIDMEIFQFF